MLAACAPPGPHTPEEYAQVTQIVAGALHNCALLSNGTVRCWGRGERGQLGYGNVFDIGDDDAPAEATPVQLGSGRVVKLSAGFEHTCAVIDNGELRCWGQNAFGQLGYGHTESIGDNELPISAGSVQLGEKVVDVAAGGLHTCVLLERGAVRCFGDNTTGQLGYGNKEDIGDDETPELLPDVDIGEGEVVQLVAGQVHTCALFATGSLRCWGRGERPLETAVGGHGQLGYGNTENIGDNETPAEAGDVPVGAAVLRVAAGIVHTCAVVEGGGVRCWGRAEGRQGFGQLGYQQKENVGDDDLPSDFGDVDTGALAVDVAAGDTHSCLVDAAGELRCWGFGGFGQLGYGNMDSIGDDEAPRMAGVVAIGEAVTMIAAGNFHTCVLTESARVYCWGLGNSGQLGYCDEQSLGDDETPISFGPVPL